MIREQARQALQRAGEHAASLAAGAEAERYFEKALALADDDTVRAELHDRAGQMARLQGHLREARTHYEESIAIHNAVGLSGSMARVSARLGDVDYDEDRLDEGITRMEQALAVLQQKNPDDDERRANIAAIAAQRARMLSVRGEVSRALEGVELALEIAEAQELPEVLAQALVTKAICLQFSNRPKESGALLEYALQFALSHDLHLAAARAYHNLGQLRFAQDRFQEALELCGLAGAQATRIGDHISERASIESAAECLIELGRWDEALGHLTEVIRGEGSADKWGDTALTHLIRLHALRGDDALARQLYETHTTLLEGSESPEQRTASAAAMAALFRAENKPSDALQAAESALHDRGGGVYLASAIVEAVESTFDVADDSAAERLIELKDWFPRGEKPSLEAHRLRWRALLQAKRGPMGEGIADSLRSAMSRFEGLQMPYWQAITQLDLGELLISNGRVAEADELLAAARSTFEQLRATPYLKRLDRLTSSTPLPHSSLAPA